MSPMWLFGALVLIAGLFGVSYLAGTLFARLVVGATAALLDAVDEERRR